MQYKREYDSYNIFNYKTNIKKQNKLKLDFIEKINFNSVTTNSLANED